MTCVSLRSGRASSDTRVNDTHPAAAPANARRTTATRCLTERSMSRLIMAPHPAFRIQQEGARDDDAFTAREPFENFDPIAEAAADANVARLERAAATFDEHGTAQPGREDRLARDGQCRGEWNEQVNVDEHVGAEHEVGVVDVDAQL